MSKMPVSGASHRESDNDYAKVLANFDPNCRIIDGKCGLQWIIQKRDGQRAGRTRWTGWHYLKRRERLIELYRQFCDVVDPNVLVVLQQLPEIHPGRGGTK